MELHLQPLASRSFLTDEPFEKGDRVVSVLLQSDEPEVQRYDFLESDEERFSAEGNVLCRWVHVFKPKEEEEKPEQELKLTAENLFLQLCGADTEASPENTPLKQFLGLMLERKRILRNRGLSDDGERIRYEHAKSKEIYDVPVADMDPEFFVKIQDQLGVLLGTPSKPDTPPADESGPAEETGKNDESPE